MTQPPPPPSSTESIVRFVFQYEYYKRNPPRQAHMNLCEMITSEKTKEVAGFLPYLIPEVGPASDDDHPPMKRTRMEEKKPVTPTKNSEESDDEEFDSAPLSDPEMDSDTSGLSEPIENENKVYSRKFDAVRHLIEMLYEGWAKEELNVLLDGRTLNMRDISKVICIRRLVSPSFHPQIFLPIDKLDVSVEYRKIELNYTRMGSEEWGNLTYMSHEEGCLRWNSDSVRLVENAKYQDLAARDFITLVQNAKFREMDFPIGAYKHYQPPIWPFSSFYGKIRNYMSKFNIQIETRHVLLTTFKERSVAESGKKILNSIWKFLKPESLNSMELFVWDDIDVLYLRRMKRFYGDLLTGFYGTEQWNNLKMVDLRDEQILVKPAHFGCFHHFELVVFHLQQNHFKDLILTFLSRREVKTKRTVKFFVDDDFDFVQARNVIWENTYKGEISPGITVKLDYSLQDDVIEKVIVFTLEPVVKPKKPDTPRPGTPKGRIPARFVFPKGDTGFN